MHTHDVAADVRRQEIVEEETDEVRVEQGGNGHAQPLRKEEQLPLPGADREREQHERGAANEPGDVGLQQDGPERAGAELPKKKAEQGEAYRGADDELEGGHRLIPRPRRCAPRGAARSAAQSEADDDEGCERADGPECSARSGADVLAKERVDDGRGQLPDPGRDHEGQEPERSQTGGVAHDVERDEGDQAGDQDGVSAVADEDSVALVERRVRDEPRSTTGRPSARAMA